MITIRDGFGYVNILSIMYSVFLPLANVDWRMRIFSLSKAISSFLLTSCEPSMSLSFISCSRSFAWSLMTLSLSYALKTTLYKLKSTSFVSFTIMLLRSLFSSFFSSLLSCFRTLIWSRPSITSTLRKNTFSNILIIKQFCAITLGFPSPWSSSS